MQIGGRNIRNLTNFKRMLFLIIIIILITSWGILYIILGLYSSYLAYQIESNIIFLQPVITWTSTDLSSVNYCIAYIADIFSDLKRLTILQKLHVINKKSIPNLSSKKIFLNPQNPTSPKISKELLNSWKHQSSSKHASTPRYKNSRSFRKSL